MVMISGTCLILSALGILSTPLFEEQYSEENYEVETIGEMPRREVQNAAQDFHSIKLRVNKRQMIRRIRFRGQTKTATNDRRTLGL